MNYQGEDQTGCLGTVVALQANFYRVQLDSPNINTDFLCTRRSRLKKIGQQVMVGDRILLEELDYQDRQGVIAQVLPRTTELNRPMVANAQQLLLVFTLAEPSVDVYQLSRFLVKAESTALTPCLCFNKIDLVNSKQQQAWEKRLTAWGYQPLFTSVMTNQGLKQLATYLDQKITVIAGASGVGKSSLINRLIPDINLRVAKVSGKLGRGRHTTRHVELFQLETGGLLADTPGFNQPDLHCNPTELVHYFPEARQRLNQGTCRFSDCLHRDEPGCVVRGDWERYEHYLKFLAEATTYYQTQHQTADQESSLKLKIKQSGKHQYEPRLESKKYRRTSRRKQHQILQEFYEEVDC